MGRKTYRLFLAISLIIINTTLIGTVQETTPMGVNPFDTYEELYNLNNKDEELIFSLSEQKNTPLIRYLGPDNLPIEGFDLKSHSDGLFEIDFRLDDNTPDEWVIRVYAYLDYNIGDTSLADIEKFEDGSDFKQYQSGTPPIFNELNPDESFMGKRYSKILEDYGQWTSSERDYTAKKENVDISDELYFHVKVLYKIEFEGDDYYYYRTFYISKYWTSNFEIEKLNIYDDDTSKPTFIDIITPQIYDCNTSIDFEIIVEDESGIAELYIDFLGNIYSDDDKDHHISIPNPKIPGEYNFNVVAFDADDDRLGDQLSSNLYSSLKILDDDLNSPIFSNVSIINTPIYDNYNNIIFEIMAEDEAGIAELFIDFMDQIYYYNEVNNHIVVPNPIIPEIYEFSAVAVDNDVDYGEDQLNTTITSTFEVFDDDITPPQIIIYEDKDYWNIIIIDNDGISDSEASGDYILANQYEEILAAGTLDQEEVIYQINKKIIYSEGIGSYTLTVQATNKDREWEGDEEISKIIKVITLTPEKYFTYINQQIEDLKSYICNILYLCDTCCCLLDRFNSAQEDLENAYINFLSDDIVNCLDLLEKARSKLSSLICLVEWFYYMGCIGIEDKNFILLSLQDIQNNIDYLINYLINYM